MNRNSEHNFYENPTNLDISRSKFNRNYSHKTTLNTGELIPLGIEEVLPGDTFSVNIKSLIRMTTPIFPTMDNAYLDTYSFFVPNRIVWEHWKEIMGENTTDKWTQTTEYAVPQITAPTGGWDKGTIADYFGIPTKISNISVNHMPFRAFTMIYNEWFRDQNLIDPCQLSKDDTTVTGSNGTNPILDVIKGGKPPKVAKYHDYFTSALPEPQKGPDVLLPLGNLAPVITTSNKHTYIGAANGLGWSKTDGTNLNATTLTSYLGYYSNGTGDTTTEAMTQTLSGPNGVEIQPNNLWTDLSQSQAATINQLRQAFAVQKLYEKDARGGTRYREILKSHFGVTSPDGRQQVPEYLGGKRIPINMTQVTQTSGTTDTSPQGNTSAFSLTIEVENKYIKSFTEHGFIITVGCVRTDHTYQQGIEKFWSRKSRLDYYFPVFANLGEQPILNKEIYAQGNTTDDEVFGYQEAWADYRYKPNRVSGALRSNYATTLDSWHYADYYESQPFLSAEWISETKANVDRTLAVQSSVEDQFIIDTYFEQTVTRAMPLYSIPGLIDHH